MMDRSSRSLALLVLLLATVTSFGVDAGHRAEHPFELELAEAPRFDAGHEAPISEEHVEAARRVADEGCLACALRSPDPAQALSASGPAALAPPVDATPAERRTALWEDPVQLRPGRAPPA